MIDWTVKETVISLMSDMGTLSVVLLINGEYAITVEREPIKALYWHAGQLEDCIATAARMAGRDLPRKVRSDEAT